MSLLESFVEMESSSRIPLRGNAGAGQESRPPHWRAVLKELGPELAARGSECDRKGAYVAENMSALRKRGFLELGVPEAFGGAGLSLGELADMLRELAHLCPSTALILSMHTHQVATAAWRYVHQNAPMEMLLKQIAADRIQLVTSGASDWLGSSGKVVKVDGGYRVHARKAFASGVLSAALLTTSAIEEDGADERTVLHFAVPVEAEGISVVETWDTLGMRGTASHDLMLENVFVPDSAVVLRRKPEVWHPMFHLIAMTAIPLVYSVYTGIAEAARDITVNAARRRPNGVVDTIGALDVELAATRIALRDLVALAEQGAPSPETTNAVFIRRALVARSAMRTVELAMDAAGGAGFFRPLGLERLFRDVQAARYHPLPELPQRRLAARMALGMSIDDLPVPAARARH